MTDVAVGESIGWKSDVSKLVSYLKEEISEPVSSLSAADLKTAKRIET